MIEWLNDCLTTPQHKNKSAIGCQTNGIYIKNQIQGEEKQQFQHQQQEL